MDRAQRGGVCGSGSQGVGSVDLGVIRNCAVSNTTLQIPKEVTQDQSTGLKGYSTRNI